MQDDQQDKVNALIEGFLELEPQHKAGTDCSYQDGRVLWWMTRAVLREFLLWLVSHRVISYEWALWQDRHNAECFRSWGRPEAKFPVLTWDLLQLIQFSKQDP